MKHTTKILAALLLTLTMVVGLMPGMSLTALAAGEKAYTDYDVTTGTNKTKSGNDLTALQVTFNERKWYIIEDNSSSATSGTVTLLSADTTFGTKKFAENNSNKYSTSQVKAYLDSMTGTGGAFADVADAIETVNLTTNQYSSTAEYETVNGVKLYLLSTEEANSLPENVRKAKFTGGDCEYNEWWLRSPGLIVNRAAYVVGFDGDVDGTIDYVGFAFGVRPALKLNLESVSFSSESQTFTMGSATVDVTGVSLDKTAAQTIDVDEKVSFTATVEPDNATDKTVKWSVGGTDAGAVKLYADAACNTEIGTDATSTLTVYAKGISAGSATVTATSNADSEKKASCDVTVNAAEPESTYTLTIPSTLTVANSGWNATDGISATGTLASGKKLTVTAASANSWALKSGDNSVGYTLTTAEGGSQTTSWEFTTLDGTAKPMGIIVEDYSNKPAGTYQDTVTFTASVEDARQLYSLTLTGPYSSETLVMEYYEGNTWNDMVAKYPNTIKVYSGRAAFGSDGFIYDHTGSAVSATAQIDPNETYEVQ